MLTIRKENNTDIDAVRDVNTAAFGQGIEASIVDRIRSGCDNIISLVALEEGNVVGHILFSPVTVTTDGKTISGMGLGPMAVLPQYQKQGIGSSLVNEGIAMLKQTDCPFIIVLGHPSYYPRFGFEPASQHGLSPQWEGIPDEAFMVLILDADVMQGVTGEARYRPEFDEAD